MLIFSLNPPNSIWRCGSKKIKQNQKQEEKEPVITVKRGNTNVYGYQVEIPGGCRVVYNPNRSISGARVWIESLYDPCEHGFKPRRLRRPNHFQS